MSDKRQRPDFENAHQAVFWHVGALAVDPLAAVVVVIGLSVGANLFARTLYQTPSLCRLYGSSREQVRSCMEIQR